MFVTLNYETRYAEEQHIAHGHPQKLILRKNRGIQIYENKPPHDDVNDDNRSPPRNILSCFSLICDMCGNDSYLYFIRYSAHNTNSVMKRYRVSTLSRVTHPRAYIERLYHGPISPICYVFLCCAFVRNKSVRRKSCDCCQLRGHGVKETRL